jgi:hypothetical protein
MAASPEGETRKIAFSFDDPQPHNIRKLRQGAGIAVAHGLPPEALEVTTLADAVFIRGVQQPMRSRQTELRDRYLPKLQAHTAR